MALEPSGYRTRLEATSTSTSTLLSFERPALLVQFSSLRSFGEECGRGAARAHLENSIAAYMVFFLIKRIRAYGGCLGAKRRRRTWAAAKSPEEVLTNR